MTMIPSYKFLSILLITGFLASCGSSEKEPLISNTHHSKWSKQNSHNLSDWNKASLVAGANAFVTSCQKFKDSSDSIHKDSRFGTFVEWKQICNKLPTQSEMLPHFFAQNFSLYEVTDTSAKPLFTGYYAPQLEGSLRRYGAYQTPVYAPPPSGIKMPDRKTIDINPPSSLKPIAWVRDPIELFFLQIQGSGQLRLDTGETIRLAYAGQNGHSYVPIGKILIDRGQVAREKMSMQAIKDWLRTHPQEANALMWENPSYVFFKTSPITAGNEGVKGAANVPLTPVGSIAIDRSIYPFGLPVWIETTLPQPDGSQIPFSGLFITQDTGGAIKGATRADLFWGTGAFAEFYSGHMKQTGKFYILLPNSITQRLSSIS